MRSSQFPKLVPPPSPRVRRPGFVALVSVVAMLGAVLVGCGDDEDGPTSASDPAAASDAPASDLPEWAPEIVAEADGTVTGLDFTDVPEPGAELQVVTVTEGDGPPVESGQEITADYLGSVYEGEAPFDESFSSQPFTAPIGVGSLIPGWDQAIPGVPVGSRILMSIPPDLGYGAAGSPPAIPGGATLFFVIDVLEAA